MKQLFLIVFLTVLVLLPPTQAQEPTNSDNASDYPSIVWKGQISKRGDIVKNPSFLSRLKNLFTGGSDQIFVRPLSVMEDQEGNLWVTDPGHPCIVKIDTTVGDITHFYGKKNIPFISTVGICEGPGSKIYITDSGLNQIIVLDKHTGNSFFLNDSLKFSRPTGIAYLRNNNEIWVVETTAHHITVLDTNGQIIRTIGKRGTRKGEFNFPTFIHVDHNGIIYVVDSMNFRVQMFNSTGDWLSMFGEAGDATGYLARPKGIATDSEGHIYLVDGLFNAVQLFSKEGSLLYYFGEIGHGKQQFWLPVGIYIDTENKIFIADSYNARLQIFEFVQGGIRE